MWDTERADRLRTFECGIGHRFEEWVSHMRPVSEEGSESLNWTLVEADVHNVTCPECGSGSVKVID